MKRTCLLPVLLLFVAGNCEKEEEIQPEPAADTMYTGSLLVERLLLNRERKNLILDQLNATNLPGNRSAVVTLFRATDSTTAHHINLMVESVLKNHPGPYITYILPEKEGIFAGFIAISDTSHAKRIVERGRQQIPERTWFAWTPLKTFTTEMNKLR